MTKSGKNSGLRLLASRCNRSVDQPGLNQGPPDYETNRMIVRDIPLLWTFIDYQHIISIWYFVACHWISMTQTVCLRIVYAEIGGILLSHTNTLFRGYKSKLFSLSKKSKSPIVRIPSSFRRGMMWSLTMIIFLKESSMLISDRDSCISFSLSGIDKADCT